MTVVGGDVLFRSGEGDDFFSGAWATPRSPLTSGDLRRDDFGMGDGLGDISCEGK